jgi:hypothetical protein
MSAKPAFHHSMLSMLSKCGMQFYYRYIEGKKSPPGVAMIIGTAVHKACELDLRHKMETGQPAPLDAVKQKAGEALEATWIGEEPMLDEDEKALGKARVRGIAKDEAVALSALANRELTPVLQPIAVEHKIRLEIGGFPFDLEGTIDVLEEHTLRDRKTASKSPSGDEADGNPQHELYHLMRFKETGQRIDTYALDYLVKNKTQKAVSVTAPAAGSFDPIKKRLELAAKVVETGAFYPADPTGPSGWVCTQKWCGYWNVCPFGRARKVQV